jgi:hypothetical protein
MPPTIGSIKQSNTKKQWTLSEQVGITSHQAVAALGIGVTLWMQGLAEHQAVAAADGGLQMQKQIAERLKEAHHWLKLGWIVTLLHRSPTLS